MNQQALKARVEAMMANGHKLPPLPDGPYLETFKPVALAQALEFEINRCGAMGWDKITLHMTPDDAARLAAHLRQNPIIRKRV
jgi:hypothetical protein